MEGSYKLWIDPKNLYLAQVVFIWQFWGNIREKLIGKTSIEKAIIFMSLNEPVLTAILKHIKSN